MPKHEDFRETRDAEHKRIKDAALQRGVLTERQADEFASARVDRAMQGVVRHREAEGTSRVIEIGSK